MALEYPTTLVCQACMTPRYVNFVTALPPSYAPRNCLRRGHCPPHSESTVQSEPSSPTPPAPGAAGSTSRIAPKRLHTNDVKTANDLRLGLERIDDRFDYQEVRVYAISIVDGIEITIIYADLSGAERRIILASRAEQHEREAYWENLGCPKTDRNRLRTATAAEFVRPLSVTQMSALPTRPSGRRRESVYLEPSRPSPCALMPTCWSGLAGERVIRPASMPSCALKWNRNDRFQEDPDNSFPFNRHRDPQGAV